MDAEKKKINIPLGSGYIYECEFSGAIPEDAVIEAEANRLGYIEKGATLTYKPTKKTFKDDYGYVSRTITTEEEATLKFSMIAWEYGKMPVLCSTARIEKEEAHSGRSIIKIGGAANEDGKRHLFRFVHPDKVAGDVRVTVVGTNTGGFSLAYSKEEASNFEVEVTAEPADKEGSLIIVYFDDPAGST